MSCTLGVLINTLKILINRRAFSAVVEVIQKIICVCVRERQTDGWMDGRKEREKEVGNRGLLVTMCLPQCTYGGQRQLCGIDSLLPPLHGFYLYLPNYLTGLRGQFVSI